MTKEHIDEVIDFMERESEKIKTPEDAIRRLQELRMMDAEGEFIPPYDEIAIYFAERNRDSVVVD